MVEIAFRAFIWVCVYGIPISLIVLLLCIRWAPSDESQASGMDPDYYGHGYGVDQVDRRPVGKRDAVSRTTGTDAAREGLS